MFINCKTWFSYRYGTYSTEALVDAAAERGLSSLGLCNINSTADTWDFVDFCRKKKIKPLVGAEIRNEDIFRYTLLAKNDTGLLEINRFLSEHLQEKKAFPERPDCFSAVIILYPFESLAAQSLKEHEFIGILATELNRVKKQEIEAFPKKWIIRHPVTFQNKTYFNVHRLLRAIGKNTLISKLGEKDFAAPDEMFVPEAALMSAFRNFPGMISNTLQLIDSCEIKTELNTDKNKKHYSASKEDDRILLEKLAIEGLQYRYGNNPIAKARVIKELKIIDQLNFNAYFLIVWDVIRYAQNRGFYYVGRGSGANSIVAYCLKITDVDPIKLDLYFERFLNPHRTSPPDFDMDFSWKDRDEVIDYIFKRYGKDHVSLLGMYSTFQRRAVIRELGKVFGLPKEEIDQLVRGKDQPMNEDKIQRTILKYGQLLENFPNHHSIHPGGMLISEKPIYQYTVNEMPPKGFCTAQVDMFLAEKIGLFKLDILSQRGLGHIKEAIRLVKQNKGIDIDIHRVEEFMSDPKVASQIRKADTIGCFYIESPAMRQLLTKLKCDDYLRLVAASSIIRPGVSQSGMMKQYIERFHDPKKIVYLHPKMKELLEETYGVMVYQEDVIKVAHHFAGLDMGEADILRRAMSGKYRSHNQFNAIKEKFFANCREFGYEENTTAEVWRQIESFGGYSFSKAHSASFAVESYQSLYLKTYFPMEFMVAVINNFGGFYSTEFYFHELKRTGAKVNPPCVNRSEYLTNISGEEVFVGFIHIQQLEAKLCTLILEERESNGPYLSLEDFIERTHSGPEQLNILISVGAFAFTGLGKKKLLWKANFAQKRLTAIPDSPALFKEPAMDFVLPDFPDYPLEDALDEINVLGFALTDMFRLCAHDGSGTVFAEQLPSLLGKNVEVLGQLVVTKDVRTINREHMAFGTFLDPKGDWLDSIHFPPSLKRFPFQGKGFYKIRGKVVIEFGAYAVEVNAMWKVGLKGKREVEPISMLSTISI
ncbi:DNA polymerase-3 subunit alpha [Algoriphagus ratkowskyi]|uniref:DNA-directed DNA polymerase n=1 Tax=Algoriphagus ratkowskyi TaxID=57028 RepID=A0A2W7RGV7_9BACT|nr:DNA polymerase III subunit alpha [Algoriphagus ratkowskyi]PZX59624.1 DNA polymerase-3 subunit alpha [Algoriphagus ratkowskyi]TXD78654.1 DNA polymerase III subunit alpha [Algoriphagus ratkowskyi]